MTSPGQERAAVLAQLKSSLGNTPSARSVIPTSPRAVGVHVLVDNLPYQTYVDREAAEEAATMLREHWPAGKHKSIRVSDPVTDGWQEERERAAEKAKAASDDKAAE